MFATFLANEHGQEKSVLQNINRRMAEMVFLFVSKPYNGWAFSSISFLAVAAASKGVPRMAGTVKKNKRFRVLLLLTSLQLRHSHSSPYTLFLTHK